MRAALRGERDSDVPCNGCTACCTSSQFVHIGPDETDTLAHIPAELLFPAPRLPRGHVRARLRRARPLPDADRRRVLDLRAPPADVSDLRLPRLPRRRVSNPTTKTGTGRATRAPLAVHRADTDRPRRRTTRCAPPPRTSASIAVTCREAHLPTTATQLAVLAVELHDLFVAASPTSPPCAPNCCAARRSSDDDRRHRSPRTDLRQRQRARDRDMGGRARSGLVGAGGHARVELHGARPPTPSTRCSRRRSSSPRSANMPIRCSTICARSA